MSTQSTAPAPGSQTRTVAERLSAGEPYVLAFGGQATPWRSALEGLVGLDGDLAGELAAVDRAVADLLAPVATDLLTITPRGARLLDDGAAPVAPAGAGGEGADVSVPGILMAQHAVLACLPGAGVDVRATAPTSVIGHSQGVLGVALLEAMARPGEEGRRAVIGVHALARLIGAAAARATRRLDLGPAGRATPMLSVRNLTDRKSVV